MSYIPLTSQRLHIPVKKERKKKTRKQAEAAMFLPAISAKIAYRNNLAIQMGVKSEDLRDIDIPIDQQMTDSEKAYLSLFSFDQMREQMSQLPISVSAGITADLDGGEVLPITSTVDTPALTSTVEVKEDTPAEEGKEDTPAVEVKGDTLVISKTGIFNEIERLIGDDVENVDNEIIKDEIVGGLIQKYILVMGHGGPIIMSDASKPRLIKYSMVIGHLRSGQTLNLRTMRMTNPKRKTKIKLF